MAKLNGCNLLAV